MRYRSVILLGVLALMAVTFMGQTPSKYTNPGDYNRGVQAVNNQVGPALMWRHYKITLPDTTLCNPGFNFNWVEIYVTGATCSLAVSSDPAMVQKYWDRAVASDLLTAATTTTANIGKAVRDTTYMPCPVGSRLFMGRGSQIKVKCASVGVIFLSAFAN